VLDDLDFLVGEAVELVDEGVDRGWFLRRR
jgi:hypothetical protein